MIKTGRIAVVTGAAQGIGRRTAELLAERGYGLVLNDLRPASETLRAVRGLEADVLEVLGDISDEGVVGGIAVAARERWGRTDVLVNNAGISFIKPAEMLSPAEYRRVLEINLVAPFLLAKAFGMPTKTPEAIPTLTSRGACRWDDLPRRMISPERLCFWPIPRKAATSTGMLR